ncbi:MAG: sensor histidine kinase [Gemmatimonadaceae bacterium]
MISRALKPARQPGTIKGALATWAPLAFVIVALAALVVLPIVGDLVIEPHRTEIRGLTEPGRTFVTRIQVALAIQGSVLRDYLEDGEDSLVDRYRQAAEQEQIAYAQLAPIAATLGGAVQERYSLLRKLEHEWHAAVEGFLNQRASSAVLDSPLQQNLYEDLLLAAAFLDQEITTFAQLSRNRILDAERVQRTIALFLGLVSLAAVAVVGWLGHRLRLAASEAERRRVELERATESRANLMRGVSHDLKNPLNAIDGYAQLLEEELKGPLLPGQKDGVVRIRRAVRALLALINDLLELSRVEAGQLRVVPRPVELGSLMRESAEEHRAAAEAAGHFIEVRSAEDLPTVTTDPDRVRQILANLLSNAVKYTEPGGRIDLAAEPSARNGRLWTAIRVADSGSGVPSDKLEAIFEEFSRLEAHEHKPGAGLGLSIARRIARLLGGDLTVASEAGKGSAFTLWLPLDRRER